MKADVLQTIKLMSYQYGEFSYPEKKLSEFTSEFPNVFHSIQPKQCYNNAFLIIMEKMLDRDAFIKYKYSVGFLLMPDMAIPIEHAVIRKGDQYYDPTLNNLNYTFVPVFELSLNDMVKMYETPGLSVPQLYDIHRLCKQGVFNFDEVAIK